MRHSDPVRVANPPSAEEPFLRTSLLPRLLDAASRNQQRGQVSVALFEIGHVFRLADPVDEREHLAILLAGRAGEGLHAEDRGWDALDAKGILDGVLGGLGVEMDDRARRGSTVPSGSGGLGGRRGRSDRRRG